MTNDKQRERLVELIQASVNGCARNWAEVIADYLLAHGIIVPPCKVGDDVFYVHEMCDEKGDEYIGISDGKCDGLSMQKDGLWIFCRYEDGLSYWHKSDKTVFLTREEAEAKLKEGVQG